MATGEIRGPDLVGVVSDANRLDLEKLEVANGELPIDPIPGLDS